MHAATYLYAATKQASQETDGAASVNLAAAGTGFTKLAESFATVSGQTVAGYVGFQIKKTGNGCDATVELWTNSGTIPSAKQGTRTTTLPADFMATSIGWIYMPLPLTGLTASTTYHVVFAAVGGDASNFLSLEKSNQASGASQFAAAVWTAQAYGFMYQEYDQALSGDLTIVDEDTNGPRWVWFVYTSGLITKIYEYTEGTRTVRTLTQTGGSLVSAV